MAKQSLRCFTYINCPHFKFPQRGKLGRQTFLMKKLLSNDLIEIASRELEPGNCVQL